MCLLFDERKGFSAKFFGPLLSSNTQILGDPGLGLRNTNTPLTYRAAITASVVDRLRHVCVLENHDTKIPHNRQPH